MDISDCIIDIIEKTVSEDYNTVLAEDYIRSETSVNILGSGVDRIVVRDPNTNHAIKISCKTNKTQNKNEVQIYNKVSTDLRNKLLPILYVSPNKRYIVTPIVSNTYDPIIGERFCGPNAEKIANDLSEEGFPVLELETAFHNNKIVAIDYGSIKN